MNGKTIGVYEKAEENIRRLKEFLTFNGIKCTIKEYSFEELGKDGTLYAYLENGDVDLLLEMPKTETMIYAWSSLMIRSRFTL